MKTTPAASNVYGTCGEKMTFDPGRGRTDIGKLACYKHLIPLGSKAKMPHEKRQPTKLPLLRNGGDEGGRTPDLCNAIAALCQTELRPRCRVPGSEFRAAEKANFEFIENRPMRQGTWLFPFENRFPFFQECGDAFFFVLGGKADGEEIDLASEAFVEVRTRGEFHGLF